MTSATDVLLLGCAGSGKTLLVRRLKRMCAPQLHLDPMSSETTSTTGVEIDTLAYESLPPFSIREVGAPMIPMWPSFFKNSSSVVFMVDMSNIAQMSATCCELYDVLSAPAVQDKPVMILLNKMDRAHRSSTSMVRHLLRLDELVNANNLLTICEVSVLNDQNIDEVLSWILTAKQAREGWALGADDGESAGRRVLKQLQSISMVEPPTN